MMKKAMKSRRCGHRAKRPSESREIGGRALFRARMPKIDVGLAMLPECARAERRKRRAGRQRYKTAARQQADLQQIAATYNRRHDDDVIGFSATPRSSDMVRRAGLQHAVDARRLSSAARCLRER